MNFIEIINREGRKCIINVDQVLVVEQEKDYSRIYFGSGRAYIEVNLTSEAVFEIIKNRSRL